MACTDCHIRIAAPTLWLFALNLCFKRPARCISPSSWHLTAAARWGDPGQATECWPSSTCVLMVLHSSQKRLHPSIKIWPHVGQVAWHCSRAAVCQDQGHDQLGRTEGCWQLGNLPRIQELPVVGLDPARGLCHEPWAKDHFRS